MRPTLETPPQAPPFSAAPCAIAARVLPLLLLLILAHAPAAAVTVEEIPSPLPDGWVVDLTGTLPPASLEALNRQSDRASREGRGELAVVVVDSVSGADPRDFAVRLFNRWGVGSAQRDDGVLLFLSVRDRAAEIVLGDGLDDPGRQERSDRIMREVMVPRFRAGDPAGGMVDGAGAVSREIFGLPVEVDPAGSASSLAEAPRPPAAESRDPERDREASRAILVFAVVAAILGGVLTLAIVSFSRLSSSGRPGRAGAERGPGLVDPADPSDPIAPPRPGFFGQLFSPYRECPHCGEWSWSKRRRVLDRPTTWSEGLAEVHRSCFHCGAEDVYEEVIPRERETSGLSGSSGSSRRSSGGSSGRSSGFGGGRSSGGGSSGRW